jgi:hypothetical protein
MPSVPVEYDPFDAPPPPPLGFILLKQGGMFDAAPPPPPGFEPLSEAPEDAAHKRARERAEMGASAGSQVVRGMPLIGGLAQKGMQAANAAIDPLFGDEGNRTFRDRYERNLQLAKEADEKFAGEHPVGSTVANFAGGVTAGGPMTRAVAMIPRVGRYVAGAAGNLATRMGIGGVTNAGLGAGDAAIKGEDPVRGAVVGGAAGVGSPLLGRALGAAYNRWSGNTARAAAPTIEELGTAKNAMYDFARGQNVGVHPGGLRDLGHAIEQELVNEGRLPAPHNQNTYTYVRQLQNAPGGAPIRGANGAMVTRAPNAPPASFDTLLAMRSGLRETAAAGYDPSRGVVTPEGAAARVALRHLDRYIEAIPAADVVVGNAQAAGVAARLGRETAGAEARSQRLATVRDEQERANAGAFTGGNLDNKLRQGANRILNSAGRRTGLDEEEIEGLDNLARNGGGPIGNLARTVGRHMSSGAQRKALVGGIGYWLGGPVGAVALPTAGWATRRVGDAMANRAWDRLADHVAMRSPLGPAVQRARDAANAVYQRAMTGAQFMGRAAQTPIARALQELMPEQLRQ